jgi:predicted GNAT family N-acyltransferase
MIKIEPLTNNEPPPYEVRAITKSETGEMLALMCDSFGLDRVSAGTVFYSDPFFDLSMKRAIWDTRTGEMLGCLTLIPTNMRLGAGKILPICGVAGVCTNPSIRNTGIATRLIETTLAQLPDRSEFAMTGLTAQKPSLYTRLGWTPVGTVISWRAASHKLPNVSETSYVREVDSDDAQIIAPVLHKIYHNLRGRPRRGVFLRDERRWTCIEQLTAGRRLAIAQAVDGITAYCAYDRRSSEKGSVVNIHEIVAPNSITESALLAYVARREGVREVRGICNPDDSLARTLCNTEGVQFEVLPSIYLRAGHLKRAAQVLFTNTTPPAALAHLRAGLVIETDDAPIKGDPARAVSLRSFGRTIKIGGPKDAEPGAEHVRGTVAAITQLIMGARSAAELVSLGLLNATLSTQAADACDALFTRVSPALATPDVF